MVRPDRLTVPVLIVNMGTAAFPSMASLSAPGRLVVRFLSMFSVVLVVSLIGLLTPAWKVIVSPGAAAAMAARRLQNDGSGHTPPGPSTLVVTISVLACAGRTPCHCGANCANTKRLILIITIAKLRGGRIA